MALSPSPTHCVSPGAQAVVVSYLAAAPAAAAAVAPLPRRRLSCGSTDGRGRNGRLKKWTGDGRSEVNPSLGGQDDGRGWEFIHYDIANRNAYLTARKGCERAMFKMSNYITYMV